MGNGQKAPIGAIIGIIALILIVVVSIILSVSADVQLFSLLF